MEQERGIENFVYVLYSISVKIREVRVMKKNLTMLYTYYTPSLKWELVRILNTSRRNRHSKKMNHIQYFKNIDFT